jgi:hypothetical protein
MNADESLKTLGRYQIQRVLGRGAMGLVYEGLDPRLNRPVAIKTILKSHLLDETLADEYSARFVREAQAAGRLSHPNIVSVFDFGEEGDVAYLVMEFIRGRELAAHFEDNDFFDLPQAVRIMGELLDALGYAHERGIVHRDVKPANVMIESGTGRVKLTDFGVARLADANTDRTQPGTMVGTPSYMSPEQIQGLAVGSRTDLFAAGVVLYQFLTRQKPFTGGGQWTVQRKIIQDDPTPPSFANRALPPVYDTIVKRALAKDPADRYATAAEFAADLRATLAGQAAPAPAQGGAEPADDADATVIQPRKTVSPAALATLPPAARAAGEPIVPKSERLEPAAAEPARPDAAQTPPDRTAPVSAPRPSPNSRPAPSHVPKPAAAGPARPARPALWAGGALLLAALVGGLAWRALTPGESAAPSSAALPAAGTPPPSTAAGPTPPAPMPVAPTPLPVTTAAPPATTVPAPASPAPAPPPTETTATAASPAPAAAILKPEARPAAPRATAAAKLRCSDLLQRLQLGETLSAEDQQVLQKECQR